MSATSSGTGAGLKRQKNSAMAAMLKKRGIRRTHCNCPICHTLVRVPFDNWDRHRCKSRKRA